MLIQRGLAYLGIAGEEESVGSVQDVILNIRRMPFLWMKNQKNNVKKQFSCNRPCFQYQMSCHWLFVNEDQNPHPEDVNEYSRALTDAGVEHEFHRIEHAGHAGYAFQSFNIE